MIKKILIGIAVVLVAFLGYVASRDGHFHYERSGVINAPADKIFPVISNFKKGQLWNPYDQKDPNMKRTFSGGDGEVGSVLEFEGNSDVGSGQLAMLKMTPNERVVIRLTMTSPMKGENVIEYRLTPEGTGTRFTWAMSGDGGFMMKLIGVFIDCEKMIAGDFEKGIQNLKTLIEKS